MKVMMGQWHLSATSLIRELKHYAEILMMPTVFMSPALISATLFDQISLSMYPTSPRGQKQTLITPHLTHNDFMCVCLLSVPVRESKVCPLFISLMFNSHTHFLAVKLCYIVHIVTLLCVVSNKHPLSETIPTISRHFECLVAWKQYWIGYSTPGPNKHKQTVLYKP